ncbi:MAG: hypothetical protein Ct9H300mP14_04250 [Gammaproteobacteria bacterium]|nr:MAG: hypothetical protein Ct9H300mP14_04250 [Gammaproteobacteria bacterium]
MAPFPREERRGQYTVMQRTRHPRLVWTAISNVGLGVGFGLLMTAVLSFRSRVSWREGLLWGLGGYATFFFAPALGFHLNSWSR